MTHEITNTGPKNREIFLTPADTDAAATAFTDEQLKHSQLVQKEILQLMTEPVSRPTDLLKHQVSKRCRALASFMETLMDEVTQPHLKLDLPQESELTASERDSVMLGEISPHHDYCDSKSSSETPPSYNQLNYNDNLQRFFNSRPNTYASSALEHADGLRLDCTRALSSPRHRSAGAGGTANGTSSGDSRSAGNTSQGSNNQMSSSGTTQHTASNGGTVTVEAGGPCIGASNSDLQAVTTTAAAAPPSLTEALLERHNDVMEKGMVKKHRELRYSVRNSANAIADKLKVKEKESLAASMTAAVRMADAAVSAGTGGCAVGVTALDFPFGNQGIKRSGSNSWEAEILQNRKHQHMSGGGEDHHQQYHHQQQQQYQQQYMYAEIDKQQHRHHLPPHLIGGISSYTGHNPHQSAGGSGNPYEAPALQYPYGQQHQRSSMMLATYTGGASTFATACQSDAYIMRSVLSTPAPAVPETALPYKSVPLHYQASASSSSMDDGVSGRYAVRLINLQYECSVIN